MFEYRSELVVHSTSPASIVPVFTNWRKTNTPNGNDSLELHCVYFVQGTIV
jgi:hypothetical protein